MPSLPLNPTDAVAVVAVGLGLLVLLRIAATALLAAVARGTGSLARSARAVAAAVRPGIARRLVAALLGILAPGVALVPSASARPAPVPQADAPRPAPAASGSRTDASAPERPAAHEQAPAVHVVRRGETLWSIAHDHLGPRATDAQVARAWPRWWAANRRVVGPDPSLIVPGQHLRVPGRRSAGTPTQQHAAPAPTTGTPVPSALSLDPDRR